MAKKDKVLIQSKNVSFSTLRTYFRVLFWAGILLGILALSPAVSPSIAIASWILWSLGIFGKLLSLAAEAIVEGLDGNMFDRDIYEKLPREKNQ